MQNIDYQKHADNKKAGVDYRRIADLLIAAASIPFLLPIMTLVAVAVKTTSPGPAFLNKNA